MGYYAQLRSSKIYIQHEALVAEFLNNGPLIKVLRTERTINCLNAFINALADTVNLDNKGNVTGLSYGRSKVGWQDSFFSKLAPLVQSGSYLEFVGEEQEIWRYLFCNDKVFEQWPTKITITYPKVA